MKDEVGMKSAHTLARRMVEMTFILKAGREALGQSR